MATPSTGLGLSLSVNGVWFPGTERSLSLGLDAHIVQYF